MPVEQEGGRGWNEMRPKDRSTSTWGVWISFQLHQEANGKNLAEERHDMIPALKRSLWLSG